MSSHEDAEVQEELQEVPPHVGAGDYAPSVAERLALFQRAGGALVPLITTVFALLVGGIVIAASAPSHNPFSAARGILTNERELLIRIAEALLEREVLDANEMKLLIDGKDLPPRPPLKIDDHQPPLQQVLKPERRPVTGAEPAPA